MNIIIAAKIHNNSLGACLQVKSFDEGLAILREWIDEQGIVLTSEDSEQLNETYEYYNDDDADNIYTFSLGIVT